MLKKFTLTFFIISFALIVQVTAQTEVSTEKQTAIQELVTLINGDNKAEEMVNAMSRQMDSIREAAVNSVLDERADLTAAEKETLRQSLISKQKESAKRFQEKLLQKLNYNQMINEIAAIVYDKHYTLEEIRELTVFYKTPTGQKTLKTMAPIMTDTMQLIQERLIPKIPVIIKELQDEEKQEIEREVNAKKPKTKKSASK